MKGDGPALPAVASNAIRSATLKALEAALEAALKVPPRSLGFLDEAAVAGRQRRPEPEIPELHLSRVLDEARRDLPELLSDARRPLLSRRLVER